MGESLWLGGPRTVFLSVPQTAFPLLHPGAAGSQVPGGNTVARAVRGTWETPMPAPIECFLLCGQMEVHHKQLETLLSPWRAALKCQPEQGQREASPEHQALGVPPPCSPTPASSLQVSDTRTGTWEQPKAVWAIFFSLSPYFSKYTKHVDFMSKSRLAYTSLRFLN